MSKFQYSESSRQRLQTCSDEMIEVFMGVIEVMDCTILCGHRGEYEQNKLFRAGASKLMWPASKHNSLPSLAVDAAPWPIMWDDVERFCYFGGLVLGIASEMGHRLRWGGNWDCDDIIIHDQSFNDLVHFEYVGPMT